MLFQASVSTFNYYKQSLSKYKQLESTKILEACGGDIFIKALKTEDPEQRLNLFFQGDFENDFRCSFSIAQHYKDEEKKAIDQNQKKYYKLKKYFNLVKVTVLVTMWSHGNSIEFVFPMKLFNLDLSNINYLEMKNYIETARHEHTTVDICEIMLQYLDAIRRLHSGMPHFFVPAENSTQIYKKCLINPYFGCYIISRLRLYEDILDRDIELFGDYSIFIIDIVMSLLPEIIKVLVTNATLRHCQCNIGYNVSAYWKTLHEMSELDYIFLIRKFYKIRNCYESNAKNNVQGLLMPDQELKIIREKNLQQNITKEQIGMYLQFFHNEYSKYSEHIFYANENKIDAIREAYLYLLEEQFGEPSLIKFTKLLQLAWSRKSNDWEDLYHLGNMNLKFCMNRKARYFLSKFYLLLHKDYDFINMYQVFKSKKKLMVENINKQMFYLELENIKDLVDKLKGVRKANFVKLYYLKQKMINRYNKYQIANLLIPNQTNFKNNQNTLKN